LEASDLDGLQGGHDEDRLESVPDVASPRSLAPTLVRVADINPAYRAINLPEISQGAAASLVLGGATREFLESYGSMIEPIQISFAKSISAQFGGAALTESLSSQLAPLIRILEDFRSSANLTLISSLKSPLDALLRNQAMQITSAFDSVNRFAALEMNRGIGSGLRDAIIRYGVAQASLAEFALREHSPLMLGGETIRAGRLYDSYLDSLPARPIARRAAVAQWAGDAQTGLVSAESLAAPNLTGDERDALAGKLVGAVLEPWESGPSDARAELFTVLSSLEPGLPDWLKASWDDIVRDGPKAASKVANCTVECIDRALRAAAPNSEIISWLEGRSFPGEMLYDGRPTRRARVMFAMRGRSARDTALAAAQVESLVSLIQKIVEDMQSVKHGDAPSIATMRCWLLAAEAALAQLFLRV
jgi:hypothetical protein